MADSILGLPSSAKFAAEGDRFYNHRRKILHSYPNGSSPLTGLLSMIPEEKTNDSLFFWYEKKYVSPVALLRGTAPGTKTAPSTGDADDGTVADAGATASPGNRRTDNNGQPTGGTDGERKNAMHVSEQQLPVHLRNQRSALPLYQNFPH